MSGKRERRRAEDPHVHKAVKLVLRYDGVLSVPEAMRAVGFTGKCASMKSKQTQVHRHGQKVKKAKATTTAPADTSPLPITQP